MAADVLCDDKNTSRNQIPCGPPPYVHLHLHAGVKLFQTAARADQNRVGVHREGAAAGLSASLAWLHSDSSCAADKASRGCGELASIAAKRRRNLALVWRSANSGSTCRWRARLTKVKSMSPTSETTSSGAGEGESIARRSSAVSSSNLAKMPSTSGQSKPLLCALDPNLPASSNAGRDRGMPSSAEACACPCAFSARLIASQLRSICDESIFSVSSGDRTAFPAATDASSPKTCG